LLAGARSHLEDLCSDAVGGVLRWGVVREMLRTTVRTVQTVRCLVFVLVSGL